MANPQPNRFTRISTELLEAIYRAKFSRRAFKIVLWIVRHSYGWNRKWAPDPGPRETGRQIGMDHADVVRTVAGLIRAGILKKEGERFYLIKDYEGWWRNTTGGETPPEVVVNHHQSGGSSPPNINKEDKDTLKTNRQKAPAQKTRGGKSPPLPDSDVRLLTTEFVLALKRKIEEPPIVNYGAASKSFKRILGSYPRHEIQARFNAWFGSTDAHIQRRGWRVEDFFMYFNRLKDGPILERSSTHDKRERERRDAKPAGFATAEPGKYEV